MIKTCSLVPEDRANFMVTDEATLEEIAENNSKLDLAIFSLSTKRCRERSSVLVFGKWRASCLTTRR